MLKKLAVAGVVLMFLASSAVAAPKGAKAIFDSGEGPASGASIAAPKPSDPVAQAPRAEKYVGIYYELKLVNDDGSIQPVTKARTFRSGEKIQMVVRTNRPGYLTILNIGPTGNTNVLFNDYVEAATYTAIPKGSVMKFAGAPGTEKLMVMLSDNPNPMGGPAPASAPATSASAAQQPAPYQSSAAPQPAPYQSSAAPMSASNDYSTPPPPPPPAPMVAQNMEGGKSVKARGSKDIVVDNMDSSFAVINPRDGYKAKRAGGKDIVIESSGGANYGVVPVSAVSGGGILTLQVSLKHR